jgi:hypothetical chaperone protein
MTSQTHVLGLDFGTSNSAAGITLNGTPQVLELEPGGQTLPTALFFDFEEKTVAFGSDAAKALYAGDWGRYMRALKSLLGTPLLHESGLFLGKRMSYMQIVARFLAEMKSRAERQTGHSYTHALSGRPVRFHANPKRDAQAHADLTECYKLAGFEAVQFMFEPVAAARARAHVLAPGDLGLVIDIGGGTSDFTLFRTAPNAQIETLHSEGLRLGGTDFDKHLSLDHVMPLMGRGSQIRHAFGKDTHLAPNAIFADLATWQKIPFLYSPDTRRAAADLLKYAAEQDKLQRLNRVLNDERGHDLAFAVEAAKIEVNTKALAAAQINLDALQTGLTAPLPAVGLAYTLGKSAQQIAEMAMQTVVASGQDPEAVTHLIMVGGSSLMKVVESAVAAQFPSAKIHTGGALTGIIEGLAMGTATAEF